MNNFNNAIKTILKHEGGYVNHPNDPGGETNFGISKRSYPNVDIKNLTLELATQIYYDDYWKCNNYDDITNIDIAIKIFDMTVNMGARNAAKITQKALCHIQDILVDGKIGPKSITCINDCDNNVLLSHIQNEQWIYYQNRIKQNPKLKVFKNGWKKRAFS